MARIFVTGCADARQLAAGYDGEMVDFTRADWSAKGFINGGCMAALYDQLNAGDTLLICYGPHDMDAENPEGFFQPGDEFEDYLERFVNVARNRRAAPVLVIPALTGGEAWRESCIRLAARLKVQCVQEGGGA